MSNHSNQATPNGPTSSREKIEGSNPTYRASVQKEAKQKSSTKPAGDGKVAKIEGQGSAPSGNFDPSKSMVGGFGDGKYKKA